ncbi:hypothetical protein FRB94_010683 [Tulasnella sp. JGI-2019a]|nr:hypothetical protein FRB94_010683 [Tulasnella sp. JGI-2019a]KAG9034919.1 hypothetical protein FRB95_012335 [Tulasnella sp. JGI-2019a]
MSCPAHAVRIWRSLNQHCLASSPCVILRTKNWGPQEPAGGVMIFVGGRTTGVLVNGRRGREEGKDGARLGGSGLVIGLVGTRSDALDGELALNAGLRGERMTRGLTGDTGEGILARDILSSMNESSAIGLWTEERAKVYEL